MSKQQGIRHDTSKRNTDQVAAHKIITSPGYKFFLGSGLIDHSQKMTVAARWMAEKKAVGQRS